MSITTAQIKKINVMLGKLNMQDEKKAIVAQFTGNRSESTKDMNSKEAAALIGHLESAGGKDKSKMIGSILRICHEMKWTNNGKVDMSLVNHWCINRSPLKKKLDDHSYNELPKLVSQFQNLYKSYLRKI